MVNRAFNPVSYRRVSLSIVLFIALSVMPKERPGPQVAVQNTSYMSK